MQVVGHPGWAIPAIFRGEGIYASSALSAITVRKFTRINDS